MGILHGTILWAGVPTTPLDNWHPMMKLLEGLIDTLYEAQQDANRFTDTMIADQTTPNASIALATLMNPAILAPIR